MSRPVRPQPAVPGPRMPESVLRRRPAEIVSRPRPAESPTAESGPNPAADPPVVAQAADARTPAVEGPAMDGRHAGSDARPTGNDARPDGDAARWVAGRARSVAGEARPTAGGARSAPHAPSRSLLRAPRRSRVRAPAAVRARRPLPLGLMAVVLVFVGLFTVGAGFGAATGFDLGELFKGPDKPPPRDFPVLEPSRPRRLTIPAIKVEAPLLTVGLAKDDSVAVPPVNRHNEAGWFDQGPTPGQFGPALIVGHADTRTGPSVFHRLHELKPGQKIEVLREDDETAIFQVNSVERHGKEKLPIKRVYADYSRPSLRLMTCGGTWLGGDRGYSDNIVVFASLIGTKRH